MYTPAHVSYSEHLHFASHKQHKNATLPVKSKISDDPAHLKNITDNYSARMHPV
jgi:hypothetical protein